MIYLQYLIDAIAGGSIYALVAVGLVLVFGVMRLLNFAYGQLIAIGAYVLSYMSSQNAVLAGITALAAVVGMALVMELLAFRPLRILNASPAAMLVATFAVSFTLQAAYLVGFGSLPKTVDTRGLDAVFQIGSIQIRHLTVVAVCIGAGLLAGTWLILNRTDIGLQIRAASTDFRTARVLGVRANRVIGFAVLLSGVLAGAASFLLTVQTPNVDPQFGLDVTIFALVGVVVGGLDRLVAGTLGGFAIGFANTFVGDVLPSSGRVYLPSVIYGAVILVILLRPGGLFAPPGQAVERV